MDVKQLNKIIKLYYFHTLKALWDGQGKIKIYYGISRVKKQLSGKRSIIRILNEIKYVLPNLAGKVDYNLRYTNTPKENKSYSRCPDENH